MSQKRIYTTSELALCALFGALNCVLAPISIPLPFTPVPITLSVFIVLLSGLCLSPKLAFTSQVIRILAGTAGLPVFAGFQAGPGFLIGPLAGYLFACPLMVLILAMIPHKNPKAKAAGILAALAVCYLLGSVWMQVITKMSFKEVLYTAVIPFIIGDIFKGIAAFAVYRMINRQLHTAFAYGS